MPSVNLTQQSIASAKAAAKPGCKQYEITDLKSQGLRLRVGARGVRWQLRFKIQGDNVRLDIGDIDEWSIAEARDIARQAHADIRSGLKKPNQQWVDEQRIRLGKIEPPAKPQDDRRLDFKWTWEIAKEKYLAWVAEHRKPDTLRDYRQVLGTKELERFAGRAVGSITLEEMAAAVEDVYDRGVERQAEKVAATVRPLFKWLGRPAVREQTGVRKGAMLELEAPERRRQGESVHGTQRKLKHRPTGEELGRIIAICRSGAMDPLVSSAIELVVFSQQRRMQVVLALRRKITKLDDGEGLWAITAPQRKTAENRGDESDHVVPLPRPAMAAVQRALDWCEDHKAYHIYRSQRVFPQVRPRRRGDEVGPLAHLSVSAITHNVSYMPGVKARPHDVRRALGTLGEQALGFTKAETAIILDHNEGLSSNNVTKNSYSLHDDAHLKWPIMRQWADWLEEQTRLAIEADPRLTDVAWIRAQMKEAQAYSKGVKKRKKLSLEKS